MADSHHELDDGLDHLNLFVKYLPPDLFDAEFRNMFLPFGEVVTSKVMMDDKLGESRCFGFVRFSTEESAAAAMRAMNGKAMRGKYLLVKYSNKPKQESWLSPNTNISVRPLPPHTTESMLRNLFKKFGRISDVKVMYDFETRASRELGFVRFEKIEDAQKAIQSMNGIHLHPSYPPLVVQYAETEEEKHRRRMERSEKHYPSRITPLNVPFQGPPKQDPGLEKGGLDASAPPTVQRSLQFVPHPTPDSLSAKSETLTSKLAPSVGPNGWRSSQRNSPLLPRDMPSQAQPHTISHIYTPSTSLFVPSVTPPVPTSTPPALLHPTALPHSSAPVPRPSAAIPHPSPIMPHPSAAPLHPYMPSGWDSLLGGALSPHPAMHPDPRLVLRESAGGRAGVGVGLGLGVGVGAEGRRGGAGRALGSQIGPPPPSGYASHSLTSTLFSQPVPSPSSSFVLPSSPLRSLPYSLSSTLPPPSLRPLVQDTSFAAPFAPSLPAPHPPSTQPFPRLRPPAPASSLRLERTLQPPSIPLDAGALLQPGGPGPGPAPALPQPQVPQATPESIRSSILQSYQNQPSVFSQSQLHAPSQPGLPLAVPHRPPSPESAPVPSSPPLSTRPLTPPSPPSRGNSPPGAAVVGMPSPSAGPIGIVEGGAGLGLEEHLQPKTAPGVEQLGPSSSTSWPGSGPDTTSSSSFSSASSSSSSSASSSSSSFSSSSSSFPYSSSSVSYSSTLLTGSLSPNTASHSSSPGASLSESVSLSHSYATGLVSPLASAPPEGAEGKETAPPVLQPSFAYSGTAPPSSSIDGSTTHRTHSTHHTPHSHHTHHTHHTHHSHHTRLAEDIQPSTHSPSQASLPGSSPADQEPNSPQAVMPSGAVGAWPTTDAFASPAETGESNPGLSAALSSPVTATAGGKSSPRPAHRRRHKRRTVQVSSFHNFTFDPPALHKASPPPLYSPLSPSAQGALDNPLPPEGHDTAPLPAHSIVDAFLPDPFLSLSSPLTSSVTTQSPSGGSSAMNLFHHVGSGLTQEE